MYIRTYLHTYLHTHIHVHKHIYLRGLNITIYGENTKHNDPTFLQTVHNHKYYQLL